MITAEPYPTPTPSPLSGIPEQVTAYLDGLIPAGFVNTGVAAFFAVVTLILGALAHHHARRQTWLGGRLSGPVSIFTALVAASYGTSGLPNLAGVDSFARDPRSLAVDAALALLAAALVAGVAWPASVRLAAHRGRPVSLPVLRDWAQTAPLHAAGGAAAGVVLAWIVFSPLLCVAGAALGFLATGLVEHLRGPAMPSPPHEHRSAPAPVPPPISDEW